jgi:hypothetical protein
MPNYANGIIYKLARRDGAGECYVGSTCSLRQRRYMHKHVCTVPDSQHHHMRLYEHIRSNGGWDEWDCVPLEEHPCENKTQLHIRERHWVDTLRPSLNTRAPAALALAGGQAAYDAERYAANREAVLAQKAEYYAANRERLAAKMADYYAANRERLLARSKERVTCECGAEVSRSNLGTHRRSPKHARSMAAQKTPEP